MSALAPSILEILSAADLDAMNVLTSIGVRNLDHTEWEQVSSKPPLRSQT